MSTLDYLNFLISFNKRLTNILENKITNSKKFENLTDEDEELLKALYFVHDHMGLEFGNDNRDPNDLKTGK